MMAGFFIEWKEEVIGNSRQFTLSAIGRKRRSPSAVLKACE
jgi:hypothetical protein